MPYNDRLYCLWLREKYPAASPIPKLLLDAFGSAEAVYTAETADIADLCGLRKSDAARLSGKSLDRAKRVDEYCFTHGVGILDYFDPAYPARLRDIDTPPVLLFYRGILPDLNENVLISIVGMREMGDYGRVTAHRMAFEAAAAGAVIVSGMAKGIDGMAHKGAIDAEGVTLAVLGSGIDVIYPDAHTYLYGKILERGAVLTEYFPGEEPKRENFPKRNRIIAALSHATVVVEANIGSGSLITARYAKEYGRPLYAVPGSVHSARSRATNLLIKEETAEMASEAFDFLSPFELDHPRKIRIENIRRKNYFIGNWNYKDETPSRREAAPPRDAEEEPVHIGGVSREEELSGTEKIVYGKLLRRSPVTAEELADEAIPFSEVVTALTMLEIGGYAEALPGGAYRVL